MLSAAKPRIDTVGDHSFTLGAQYRPTGRLTLSLVIARAWLAFSTRAFLRGLIQYNDDDDEAWYNVLFR